MLIYLKIPAPYFIPAGLISGPKTQNRRPDIFPKTFIAPTALYSPDMLQQPASSKRATRWRCFIEEHGRQLFACKPLRPQDSTGTWIHPTWTNEARNWADAHLMWQAERAYGEGVHDTIFVTVKVSFTFKKESLSLDPVSDVALDLYGGHLQKKNLHFNWLHAWSHSVNHL